MAPSGAQSERDIMIQRQREAIQALSRERDAAVEKLGRVRAVLRKGEAKPLHKLREISAIMDS